MVMRLHNQLPNAFGTLHTMENSEQGQKLDSAAEFVGYAVLIFLS
jgi:hypothetical protein